MSNYTDGPITYYIPKDLEIDSCIITREDEVGAKARERLKNKQSFVDAEQRTKKLSKQIEDELKETLLKQYRSSKDPREKASILMFAVNLEKTGSKMFTAEEMQEMKEGLNKVNSDKDVSGVADEIPVAENGEDTSDNQTTEEMVEELIELTDEMEEIKKSLDGDAEEKGNFINNCRETKCISEARAQYELELERYMLEVAEQIVEKNKLVEKRVQLVLQIREAIYTGEDLTPLQQQFVAVENQINSLDANFENRFKTLRGNIETAQEKLKGAREVVKSNITKKGITINRYKEYTEGILKSDTAIFPRINGEKLGIRTEYPGDIMETAPDKDSNYTVKVAVGGEVVTVFTKENAEGAELGFVSEGVKQAGATIGETNRTLRDINGSLLKDYPELEEILNQLGMDAENPAEFCDEAEQEQEEQERQAEERENDNEGEIDVYGNYSDGGDTEGEN